MSSLADDSETPVVLSEGSLGFDWFGHAMASFTMEDDTVLLAVGAPMSAECGQECYNSPGKVALLDAEGPSLLPYPL